MLQMYYLMLVSTESAWGHSVGPADSKIIKNRMVFLITHYNMNLNTNGHLLLVFILSILGYRQSLALNLIVLQGKYELIKSVRDPLRRRHYLASCNFL